MKTLERKPLWIKLDYTTLSDDKVVKLISEYGDEGFGIYIKLILLLANSCGDHILNYNIIAYKLNSNKEIIQKVINDYDLFIIDNNIFHSNRLNNDLENMKNISMKRQEAGRNGGLNSQKNRRNES